MRHVTGPALLLATATLGLPGVAVARTASATPTHTWYVAADAPAGGTGTLVHPFRTLAAVQSASGPGDTIRVLVSSRTLDGGIRLQRGQTLVGYGGRPTLTNTTTHLSGDTVRLANGATVRGLRIAGARRGGIYGKDVTGVTIARNDVSGQNTSCTKGFLIPQFNLPTNVPGVGAPIPGGLQNGWAGIQIDADHRTGATATIRDNVVHDATCGDGIDVRTSGTAAYHVIVSGNRIHHLQQALPRFLSLLAIGLQTRDHARLVAEVANNRQSDLGNPAGPNLLAVGADSEGVFVNGVGPSHIAAHVSGNRYTDDQHLGGFSANGLEMVTMGDGTRATVTVRDSSFSGAPGDLIEEGALGTHARLSLTLERVLAEHSTGVGNTLLVPVNNGDCLVAGSLGGGSEILLTVRDSVLRDCANNGLSIGSNVVNGSGPSKRIAVDIDSSVITGNHGGNLALRSFTRLTSLSLKVQRTDLSNAGGVGSALADFSAEDLGTTDSAVIDLGGGALGSLGRNCITGGNLAADVIGYAVAARSNWWGPAGAPGPLRALVLGGSLDGGAPLPAAPAACS